ncbi:GIY-YIG nuclease family protein [Candidatus Dojkabacteria bacterium]|uniref:GIY-YIG nuclease family protein n=1 Tax=Candidatus Dojkabacteria bacterium TaxID=2099670 RepID=A0A955L208_9BACT|nr:GIY-YIG nuclease family protein [Candidatus Dojkabacteria bacterium]
MNQYFVYILLCSDNSFYIGVTNNIDRRLYEHSLNSVGYVSKRKPFKLLKSFEFNSITNAIDFEKQIKRWSSAKKKALIKEDWDRLSQLFENSWFDKLTMT